MSRVDAGLLTGWGKQIADAVRRSWTMAAQCSILAILSNH